MRLPLLLAGCGPLLAACGPPRDLNLPPTLVVHAPADGARLHEGDPLAVDVSLDDHGSPLPVRLLVTSSLDGRLHTSDDLGVPRRHQVELAPPSPGDHLLTFEALDLHGLARRVELRLDVNGAPSAPGLQVDPPHPHDDDDVVARVVRPALDPEGSPVGYGWWWLLDDEARASGEGKEARLDAALTAPGQVWTVRFEAWEAYGATRDPRGTSTFAEATVRIGSDDDALDPARDTGLTPP